MKIEFSGTYLTTILENARLKSQLSEEAVATAEKKIKWAGPQGTVEFDIGPFDIDSLLIIKEMASERGDRSLSNRIASLVNLKKDPLNARIGNLRALPGGLAAFLVRDAIKGWLFKREPDGTVTPWLITDAEYFAATKHMSEHVVVRLMANTAKINKGGSDRSRDLHSTSIIIRVEHINKKSIGELLDSIGLMKETQALHAEYDADLAKFLEYREMESHQFISPNKTVAYDDTNDSYWIRREPIQIGAGCKLVNEESLVSRYIVDEYLSDFWVEYNIKDLSFSELPYHCKLYMYNLATHEHCWMHVSKLEVYQYNEDLRDKLVLPQTHHDLIEILASDMGFIMHDIIDGKSGGTTILCKGSPGLGKTLTAEVYSEVIKKPLYRVHSGQLGTSADKVEKNLTEVLQRAARWGAVMLIDEADVFIRKRGDDIDHNAVVASFLRTLEYFDGLLFMTTNRQDDVDDAILSRCIAVIKYELPETEDAKKIWRVLSGQFGNELPGKLIDELVKTYSKASGRDIKELLKLTMKFCKGKNIAVDADAFRRCAMFRGLI